MIFLLILLVAAAIGIKHGIAGVFFKTGNPL
jgi:hypothetical protein